MISRKDFVAKQMIVLSTHEGDKLSFKNDNIVLKDAEGKTVHQSTCYTLFAIIVIGNISITSGLIQRSKKFGFSIIMLTPSLRPYCMIGSFAEGNVLLREKQYGYGDLGIARVIIRNKIQNELNLIVMQRDKNDYDLRTIEILRSLVDAIPSVESDKELLSIEGTAAKVYFTSIFSKANGIVWKGRKPRTKCDMVNCLQDIGYTVLFNYIDAIVSLFGFDRYLGVFHKKFYMRKSLICDLVEPFRIIVDNRIKTGINLKQFKEDDFEIINEQYILKRTNSGQYTTIFVKEILQYKEEIFLYVRDYYRAVMKGDEERIPYWEFRG